MLKLFNTETRKKELLVPQETGKIKMYTCGPTVYNFAHIGNFRTYVFEDLLRRSLKFFGLQVTQVMNLTDVDDKTIRGANLQGISLDDFTKPFKVAFFEDLKTLNIEPVEHYPQATDYIPHMIEMIGKLLEKGLAYKGKDGSVYFAIRQFPRYGCLSHLNLDELKVGASERIDTDEYEKDSLSDFVLWKGYDPERDGPIHWDSPYGKGRPGWHLECSAMAMSILGDTLDIHVGGVDNMFPHHENEIAQSEGASGKCFSKLWMHSEHLLVDGRKMSKSLNNFYSLRDLLEKGYTGREVRYTLLQTHYKTQLNFTFEGLQAARTSLQRLQDFVIRLNTVSEGTAGSSSKRAKPLVKASLKEFTEALADDLNISQALATLFDLVRETHTLIDQNKLDYEEAKEIRALLEKFDTILGVIPFEKGQEAPKALEQLLQERLEARKNKNWLRSDQIRDEIQAAGWTIEDHAKGSRLKKIT